MKLDFHSIEVVIFSCYLLDFNKWTNHHVRADVDGEEEKQEVKLPCYNGLFLLYTTNVGFKGSKVIFVKRTLVVGLWVVTCTAWHSWWERKYTLKFFYCLLGFSPLENLSYLDDEFLELHLLWINIDSLIKLILFSYKFYLIYERVCYPVALSSLKQNSKSLFVCIYRVTL